MNKERLAKADWVAAGLDALARSGVAALKADSLAKALNVSRGSFYWHFADVAAYHAAILSAWEAQATHDVIAQVESKGGGAFAKLHRLSHMVFSTDGALERQIRAWASQNEQAAKAQARVDVERIAYVRALIEEAGAPNKTSEMRARFFYMALIGQFATGRRYAFDSADLKDVIDLVVMEKGAEKPK